MDCVVCGQPIHAERLRAMPNVLTCTPKCSKAHRLNQQREAGRRSSARRTAQRRANTLAYVTTTCNHRHRGIGAAAKCAAANGGRVRRTDGAGLTPDELDVVSQAKLPKRRGRPRKDAP